MKRILFAFSLVCFSFTPAGAAFFSNGSFETGPGPGTFITLGSGATSIDSWTVGGGGIDYIGTYWTAADGSRSIDLAGTGPASAGYQLTDPGSISQTFDTIANTTYRITFFMAGNPDGGERNKDLRVTIGNSFWDFSFDTLGKTRTNMGWQMKSFDFTPTTDSTTITFTSLEGISPFGAALDNVAATAVPIPAAAWLLGTGLIGLVVIRRRVKK